MNIYFSVDVCGLQPNVRTFVDSTQSYPLEYIKSFALNMVYERSHLPEGVLVPTLCFFKEGPKQEVDLELVGKHAVR